MATHGLKTQRMIYLVLTVDKEGSMEFLVGLVVGFVGGGAVVWFFKEKALKLAKELEAKAKEEVEELKGKVKELKEK